MIHNHTGLNAYCVNFITIHGDINYDGHWFDPNADFASQSASQYAVIGGNELQCCGSILLGLYVIFGYILHKNDQTSDGDYGDEDDPDNTPEVISQRENKKNVRNVSSNIIAVVYVIAGFVLEYLG